MKGLKNLKGLNESTGLTGLGGLFGFASANQAAISTNSQKYDKKETWGRNAIVTLLSFAIMGFFASITVNIKSLNPLTEAVSNFSFTDIYYGILHDTGDPQVNHTVTVIDIYQFQGRGNYAKLLEDIEALHPAVICVDAVFEGLKLDDQNGDMELSAVVEKYDNLIFSMKMEEVHSENGMWVSYQPIHSYFTEYVDTREAFCNMERGNLYDAMKREIPITARVDSTIYKSMIVETVNYFVGHDITEGRNDAVKINYTPTTFQSLKPSEIKDHPDLIKDHIVLLGDLHDQVDQHWSPLGEKLAGVIILAYGIQTMLDKTEIIEPHWFITCILSYIIVLIMLYIINAHTTRTQASKNLIVKFLLGSAYARSIIIFGYSSLLLMISFIIFSKWNISFSWGWALSGVAFLGTAGNFYNAIQGYYTERVEKKKRQDNVTIET